MVRSAIAPLELVLRETLPEVEYENRAELDHLVGGGEVDRAVAFLLADRAARHAVSAVALPLPADRRGHVHHRRIRWRIHLHARGELAAARRLLRRTRVV